MADARVASRDKWLAARKALLAREKALTRQRDEDGLEYGMAWVRYHDKY